MWYAASPTLGLSQSQFLTTQSSPSAHSFRSSSRAASPAQNSSPDTRLIRSPPYRFPHVNEDGLRFQIMPIPPLYPWLLSQL